MIKGILEISLLDERYKYDALNSLDTLLDELYIDGVLYHQKIGANKVKQEALLEDYSFLIDLLLHAYEVTYKKEYLLLSKELIDKSFEQFYKKGIWYSDKKKEYKASFNDKYYVSALSIIFHNLLSYSNLVYDLDMLDKTKKTIETYKKDILNNMDNSPEAIRAIIRKDIGDIIIKSNKTNMEKGFQQIENINYPFILKNIEQTLQYLACDEKSCFAYDRSLNKLIEKIEK
jgi:uncharacterized protein YyaL (SSP411 family)